MHVEWKIVTDTPQVARKLKMWCACNIDLKLVLWTSVTIVTLLVKALQATYCSCKRVSAYSLRPAVIAESEETKTPLKKGVVAGPYGVLPPINTEQDHCHQMLSPPQHQYVTGLLGCPTRIEDFIFCFFCPVFISAGWAFYISWATCCLCVWMCV